MDNRKFEIILHSLIKRSEEDSLNWKTTASSSTYLLALKGSSISIMYVDGRIIVDFRNEKGEVVESIMLRPSDELYLKAEELYVLARRKALKADETIDRILEQLNTGSIAA